MSISSSINNNNNNNDSSGGGGSSSGYIKPNYCYQMLADPTKLSSSCTSSKLAGVVDNQAIAFTTASVNKGFRTDTWRFITENLYETRPPINLEQSLSPSPLFSDTIITNAKPSPTSNDLSKGTREGGRENDLRKSKKESLKGRRHNEEENEKLITRLNTSTTPNFINFIKYKRNCLKSGLGFLTSTTTAHSGNSGDIDITNTLMMPRMVQAEYYAPDPRLAPIKSIVATTVAGAAAKSTKLCASGGLVRGRLTRSSTSSASTPTLNTRATRRRRSGGAGEKISPKPYTVSSSGKLQLVVDESCFDSQHTLSTNPIIQTQLESESTTTTISEIEPEAEASCTNIISTESPSAPSSPPMPSLHTATPITSIPVPSSSSVIGKRGNIVPNPQLALEIQSVFQSDLKLATTTTNKSPLVSIGQQQEQQAIKMYSVGPSTPKPNSSSSLTSIRRRRRSNTAIRRRPCKIIQRKQYIVSSSRKLCLADQVDVPNPNKQTQIESSIPKETEQSCTKTIKTDPVALPPPNATTTTSTSIIPVSPSSSSSTTGNIAKNPQFALAIQSFFQFADNEAVVDVISSLISIRSISDKFMLELYSRPEYTTIMDRVAEAGVAERNDETEEDKDKVEDIIKSPTSPPRPGVEQVTSKEGGGGKGDDKEDPNFDDDMDTTTTDPPASAAPNETKSTQTDPMQLQQVFKSKLIEMVRFSFNALLGMTPSAAPCEIQNILDSLKPEP